MQLKQPGAWRSNIETDDDTKRMSIAPRVQHSRQQASRPKVSKAA